MTIKPIIQIAIASTLLSLLPSMAHAETRDEDILKFRIQQFYSQMAQGEYEEAFSFVSTGTNGFLHYGMRVEIPNDGVKAMITQRAKDNRAKGEFAQMQPKHIEVKMLGKDNAIATYYVEGDVTKDGKKKHVVARASLVLRKSGDDWKIVHWHVSDLKKEEDSA